MSEFFRQLDVNHTSSWLLPALQSSELHGASSKYRNLMPTPPISQTPASTVNSYGPSSAKLTDETQRSHRTHPTSVANTEESASKHGRSALVLDPATMLEEEGDCMVSSAAAVDSQAARSNNHPKSQDPDLLETAQVVEDVPSVASLFSNAVRERVNNWTARKPKDIWTRHLLLQDLVQTLKAFLRVCDLRQIPAFARHRHRLDQTT